LARAINVDCRIRSFGLSKPRFGGNSLTVFQLNFRPGQPRWLLGYQCIEPHQRFSHNLALFLNALDNLDRCALITRSHGIWVGCLKVEYSSINGCGLPFKITRCFVLFTNLSVSGLNGCSNDLVC